jgi:hypothetical protein
MRDREAEHSALSERIRVVRMKLFGEHGGPILARRMCIPQPKLARMEAGRPISGVLILKLIEVTGVNAHWLLYGEGEMFGQTAFYFAGDKRSCQRSTG